jgi:sugar O-acyltransferase (sialic acid O-acetyltransferase NeuD family)
MAKQGGIGLLGAGDQADETESFASPLAVTFRAVSVEYLRAGRRSLVDISTRDPALLATPVVAAVGTPGLRRELVGLWGGTAFAAIVSPAAWVDASAVFGAGVTVAPHVAVSVGVHIGDHVLLNIGCSVSHGSVLGDFVTVSPGVRIAGNCVIGDGVFLGIGASVSNEIRIAEGTVVGAGAVVTRDIDSPGVYVGVPARRLRDSEEWIRGI